MDGGVLTMVKKSVIFLIMFVLLGFSAFAEEDKGPEYLQEYDNYYEFEQDYNDSVVTDKIKRQKNPLDANPLAMLAGAALGVGAVYIVFRNKLAPPAPSPYFRKPTAKHEITNEKDNFER